MTRDTRQWRDTVKLAMGGARLLRGMTQQQFADAIVALGVSADKKRVDEWEGGTKTPRATVLLATAQVAFPGIALGESLMALFSDIPRQQEIAERSERLMRQEQRGEADSSAGAQGG